MIRDKLPLEALSYKWKAKTMMADGKKKVTEGKALIATAKDYLSKAKALIAKEKARNQKKIKDFKKIPPINYEVSGKLQTMYPQYFVFEQRMTMCLRLSCPLPVIGQLELM